MFDNLKRLQLQRRGLSCGKVRRKHGDNEVARALRLSGWVKTLLFLVLGIALAVLAASGEGEAGTLYFLSPAATIDGLFVVYLATIVHFFVNHPRNFLNNSRILLIFGSVALQLAALRLLTPIATEVDWGNSGIYLLFPFAFAPLLLTVLLGRNFGLFANVITGVLAGFLIPLVDFFPVLVINLICGFVSVFTGAQIRRRAGLMKAGFHCGVSVALGCFIFGYLDLVTDGDQGVLWVDNLWRASVPVVVGLSTGLLIAICLPTFERAFQATSNISWVELSDLNHPLLRRLSLEAPGTYHHSLMVAHLSEAAAEAVGANVTLCRVCSYFHDVGKLNKPEYCIENIGGGAQNPHDELTPNMSAIVIMAHVKDGVDLAVKHGLNDEILDVIEQHHGTSLILYFFNKALAKRAELERQAEAGDISPDDVPSVDDSRFRYPGPTPQFKESAIISLADALESASRSLEKPTPQRVEQLVEDIVRGRMLDGQLDQCDLTLQELAAVKESFTKTLRSMLHSRISYKNDTEKLKSGDGDQVGKESGSGGESGSKSTTEGNSGSGGSREGKAGDGSDSSDGDSGKGGKSGKSKRGRTPGSDKAHKVASIGAV